MTYCVFLALLVLGVVWAENAKPDQKDPFEQSLQDMKIATTVLTNVPYGNAKLPVWEHMENTNTAPEKNRYFVMPVVELLPASANCTFNVFTGKTYLQFDILMWNEDVSNAVLMWLRRTTGFQTLQNLQISTLPMEEIRLFWATSVAELSDLIELDQEWQSYANQENVVTFIMVVKTKEFCEQALAQLRSAPAQSFRGMQLQYVLHAVKAARKEIFISGNHVMQTKMFAKLQNNVDPNGNVYLQSNDMNQLSRETVQKVVASSITDVDYINTGDEASLTKLLENSLTDFRQSSTAMTPRMWNSTFWDKDWSRADKMTQFLNHVIQKDEGTNHTVHVNDAELQKNWSAEAHVSGLFGGLIGGGASGGSSSHQKTHISDDDLRQWLLDNDYQVNWNGESFRVKPMDLYRLNLGNMGQREQIVSTYVQVRQMEYTQSVQVSFSNQGAGSGSGIQTSSINQRFDDLERATRKEIGNVKQEVETLSAEVKQNKQTHQTDVNALKKRTWTPYNHKAPWYTEEKQAFPLPDDIPLNVSEILLYIYTYSGTNVELYGPSPINKYVQIDISVWSRDQLTDEKYMQRLYAMRWGQDALSWNSDNLWVPIVNERVIWVEPTFSLKNTKWPINKEGLNLQILGYRTHAV